MQISQEQKAVDELLSEFDSEMNKLRKKFHIIIKKYEQNRIEHLRDLVSKIKSV